VPHNNFESADGRWVTIACTNDEMFDRLAEAMGRGDMTADVRYATNSARIANRASVNAAVAGLVPRLLGTPGQIRRLGAALGEPSPASELARWASADERTSQ
jgi:hypothetical protein